MKNIRIEKDTTIEELTSVLPESVSYLMAHGIRCIRCGEPVWDTLETAARRKGFTDADIERFVEELNHLMR